MRELICEAIRRKKLLKFRYGNSTRVVEPHTLGQDSSAHDILSAYLVRGYSESQKEPYWRFFRLSNVTLMAMLDERFPGPREGYNPKDPRLPKVYCSLETSSSEGQDVQ